MILYLIFELFRLVSKMFCIENGKLRLIRFRDIIIFYLFYLSVVLVIIW